MKEQLMSLLRFLNLLDQEQKLSITNVAMVAMLGKMLVSPIDWPSALALFTLAANYAHKRYEANKEVAKDVSVVEEVSGATATLTKELENLKSQISSLMLKAGIR